MHFSERWKKTFNFQNLNNRRSIQSNLETSNIDNKELDLERWYEKAETLRYLINLYEKLPQKDKNQVQAIHEYLVCKKEIGKNLSPKKLDHFSEIIFFQVARMDFVHTIIGII